MDAKLNGLKIPNHIAIIMDGNGRWAKKRMMPRNYGHKAGSKIVEDICREAYNIGVKYVTVYAFSTENWSRPQSEIDTLMKLLRDFLSECLNKSKKNNMRVHVIGDITKLEQSLQDTIVKLEEVSASNTGLCFQVALNYGGQDEILRATRKIAQDVKDGKLSIEDLNTEVYEDYLDTKGIPAPDLLIRTSGEQRLSNFLLWQLAYTEFYFPEVLWPDFNKKELIKAIEFYNGRERRYGGVG
ncbi:MAG TPA: isoprenyl transferase [Lachnoclostridium phytofermentans]|uniref:Isoprenyl transferase n=1 Tax=Lachnoclostridium phytofermentans TaxID=66219 RepID=A0A3D2X518_9FIRM|nr:isoprenyl transferase [Lachnoclostridium sp.]HCL02229.1 isoprenyl transferase [Lachnoclostridium phytofermentans]